MISLFPKLRVKKMLTLRRRNATCDHISNTVKTPNKRKIGRALFFSYREFSLTWSFSKVYNEIAKTGLLNGFVVFIIFDYMQNISRLHPMT